MEAELIISIASGKGGTGKTTVACRLASVIDNCVYIDCDVEEPNGHILLKPKILIEDPSFKLIPEINYDNVTFAINVPKFANLMLYSILKLKSICLMNCVIAVEHVLTFVCKKQLQK